MKSKFKKVVKEWGSGGGVLVPKDLVGEEVYVITKQDLQDIQDLKVILING